jgi:hypothetical protein
MRPVNFKDLAESIRAIQALLDAIGRDLACAPAWKRGTPWWNTRVREHQRLLAQREFLRGKQAEWASLN